MNPSRDTVFEKASNPIIDPVNLLSIKYEDC